MCWRSISSKDNFPVSSRPTRRNHKGQVGKFDLPAFPHHDCPFYGVFQLPDVPWPGIPPHRFQGLRMDGVDLFVGLRGIASQEMLGQQGDIVRPVPQGRHLDVDDVQPVESPAGSFCA